MYNTDVKLIDPQLSNTSIIRYAQLVLLYVLFASKSNLSILYVLNRVFR